MPAPPPARPPASQVKSLLVDFFRGRVVETVNLAGLDRVILVRASVGAGRAPAAPASSRRQRRAVKRVAGGGAPPLQPVR